MNILSKLTSFFKSNSNKENKQYSQKSIKSQRKELKKLEKTKLKELNSKRAFRKFNVKGVTHENRQDLLYQIIRKHGSEGLNRIEFIPEHDNKYDPNAIKIVFENIGHIGYIPKEKAVSVGKLLEKNTYDIKWNIDIYCNENSSKEDVYYMEIRLYSK